MNKKNEVIIEPLYASSEQINKGFCEESWFLIEAISNKSPRLFYFNPTIDPTEFENFKEFVEKNISEFTCPGDSSEPHKTIKENYASISSCSGELEEDFDEESKQTFIISTGKAAITEFHKGGFNKEKILELIKNINKNLINLENEGAFEASSSLEDSGGQYKYSRLKRSRFN